MAEPVPPTPDRPYIAAADELASPSQADNERHALARSAFMAQRQRDPRVRALFDTWGVSTELYAAADAIPDAVRVVRRTRQTAALQQATERLPARMRAFLDQPAPPPDVFVVETLGLRWPWVAFELVDTFRRLVEARAYKTDPARQFHADVQAPPGTVGFATRPGELLAEARRRWQALVRQVDQVFEAHVRRLPKGRRPAHQGTTIARDVAWFYRARVQAPRDTVLQLAREYHAEHHPPAGS